MSDLWWDPVPQQPARVRRALGAARRSRGVVDYTLAKRALLREFRNSLLSRLKIYNAHPKLLHTAHYLGTEATSAYPVCDKDELRLLAYVYGDRMARDN